MLNVPQDGRSSGPCGSKRESHSSSLLPPYGSSSTSRLCRKDVAKPSARFSLIERLYDPATWQERTGVIAASARLFFKVFSGERSAWICGSGASFTFRIVVAHIFSTASESRVLLPVVSYLAGILVGWPVIYKLLRMQDRRACVGKDGVLDENTYRAGAFRRALFLPKQEIGFVLCFTVVSAAVMTTSLWWPALFGGFGSAVISVGAALLQGIFINRYEAIFKRLGDRIAGKTSKLS